MRSRPELAGNGEVADLLQKLESDPAACTEPRCRHFGVCGGCDYQHLTQASQLKFKTLQLHRLLRDFGIQVPASGIQIHAAMPWEYRNRIRLRVQRGETDRPTATAVGYSRRATHDFLPIEECPIAAPKLWHTANALQNMIRAGAANWPNRTTELELFTTPDESALQMTLHVDATVTTVDRETPSAFRKLCDAISKIAPLLTGAGLLVQGTPTSGTSRRVQERQRVEIARWGEPGMRYIVAGREYPVSRGSFFQVNRFLTERMVSLVVNQRGGDLAMDLFAGAGLFSRALSESFARVVSVEIGEPAVSDLARMLHALGPQHRAVKKTTLDFLRNWQHSSGTSIPDLVVMDPPRAGLGDAVVHELLHIGPPEMVYISCDPTTFVRDTKRLVESRYTVAELHLLDLFPQTLHMETIAVFRRV